MDVEQITKADRVHGGLVPPLYSFVRPDIDISQLETLIG